MRTCVVVGMSLALAVGAAACGDDETQTTTCASWAADCSSSSSGSSGTSSSGSSGSGTSSSGSSGGVIDSCATACAHVADCLGFASEAFGKDEASCLQGCDGSSDMQPVFSCLQAAGCDAAAVEACSPTGP